MVEVFVYAPTDFKNLCVLARTLEVFGVTRCAVFDPNRLIRATYGRSYKRRLKTVSAGAFEKIDFRVIADPVNYLERFTSRTIATVADPSADSLYDFAVAEDDLLVFGSEGTGLPSEFIARCDAQLTIPQRGVTQSLNLCVASGIFLGEFFRQLSGPKAKLG